MNKTIRRKLILSGITLAIAGFATTATTYAWFTSNSTVRTNEVEGNVAEDSSIYVKSDKDQGFGSSATISTEGITFKPLQTLDGKVFNDIDAATTVTANKDYLEFTLTFSGTSNTPVYMTNADIANKVEKEAITAFVLRGDAYKGDKPANWDHFLLQLTATLTSATLVSEVNTYNAKPENADKQVVLVDAQKYFPYSRGQSIKVDVADALYMTIEAPNQTQDPTTEAWSNVTSGDLTTTTVYHNTEEDTTAEYNALKYYNNVLGTKITIPADYHKDMVSDITLSEIEKSESKAVLLGYIPTGSKTELEVKFRVYLDGWDQECFDAITGQTFKAQFEFSASNKASA